MKKLIVAASILALAGAATAQAGSKPSDGAKHSDHAAPSAAPTPAPTPAPSPSPEPTPSPTPTAPAPTGPAQ